MNFLQPLKLLLPALLPSWNFFDIITPSPRIQFTLINLEKNVTKDWQEFRPRPAHFSFINMLKRMFFNPRWNESLFLVSCAERIVKNHSLHSENEILKRIEKELIQGKEKITKTHLQFRLLFIHRQGIKLNTEVLFTSRIHKLSIEINDES